VPVAGGITTLSVDLQGTSSLVPLALVPSFMTTTFAYTVPATLPINTTHVIFIIDGQQQVDVTLPSLDVAGHATVQLVDSITLHVYSFKVTVALAPQLLVTATGEGNPCSGSTLCGPGGQCVATSVASTSEYSLSCLCEASPMSFFSASCSLAVVLCPSCIANFSGGDTLSLYGFGLDSISSMDVAGVPVQHFKPAVAMEASDEVWESLALTSSQQQLLQRIDFVAPSLFNATSSSLSSSVVSEASSNDRFLGSPPSRADLQLSTSSSTSSLVAAYQRLTLHSWLPSSFSSSGSSSNGAASASTTTTVEYGALLYYTVSSQCIAAGEWKPDEEGGCLPCPTGG